MVLKVGVLQELVDLDYPAQLIGCCGQPPLLTMHEGEIIAVNTFVDGIPVSFGHHQRLFEVVQGGLGVFQIIEG
jgi:hypothetical protein